MESQVELKMNIGEAAKKSNLSVKTVRFYSDIGLINPKTNERVESFNYEFSEHQGSVQRLPNGNTLIVSGYSKQINELNNNGKIVWSLETSGRISRAYRYGLKYQGVLNKN